MYLHVCTPSMLVVAKTDFQPFKFPPSTRTYHMCEDVVTGKVFDQSSLSRLFGRNAITRMCIFIFDYIAYHYKVNCGRVYGLGMPLRSAQYLN